MANRLGYKLYMYARSSAERIDNITFVLKRQKTATFTKKRLIFVINDIAFESCYCDKKIAIGSFCRNFPVYCLTS